MRFLLPSSLPHRSSVLPGMVVAAALVIAATLPAAPVHGQTLDAAVEAQVRRGLHGADGAGKDGPMRRVGTALLRLHYAQETGLPKSVRNRLPLPDTRDGFVTVDALASSSGEVLVARLRALGLQESAVAGSLVSGRLPVAAIGEAASVPSLRSLRASGGGSGVGRFTSEGDVSLQTDAVRAQTGAIGAGVRVCALSDSYNNPAVDRRTGASDDVRSGDLPGPANPNGFTTPVRVPTGGDNADGVDEGRALLQIVHDVAPGAELAFHTAQGGIARYANAITELANPAQIGCDVIVDDYVYFAEGMLQDGAVAQAVRQAVNQHGVTYVSFAGNAGDRSYEAPFRPSGRDLSSLACCPDASGEMHDFDPTSTTSVRQQITVAPNASPNLSLQWSDPYAGARRDVDVYLIDTQNDDDLANDELVASSTDRNSGGFAYETIFTYRNDSDRAKQLDVVITLANDRSPPDLIKWVAVLSAFGRVRIDEHRTRSGTSFGHRNVAEAITVGAAAWFNTPDPPPGATFEPDDPPVLNEFSSKGDVPILFDDEGRRLAEPELRDKPDVTATDGVETTFFGSDVDGDDRNDDPNFFGTSAAAPHVAGIAALLLETQGDLSPAQVKARMTRGALDIVDRSNRFLETDDLTPIPGGTGPDAYSGAGLVQADAVLPPPVDLASFDGSFAGDDDAAGATVRLTWTLPTGASQRAFDVQRRAVGADPDRTARWTVVARNRTPDGNAYTAVDDRPPYGAETLVYRLRRTGDSGLQRYSRPLTLRRPVEDLVLEKTFPNPAQRRVTVRFVVPENGADGAVLRLYDTLGRQVRRTGARAGRNEETFDVSGLASGLYLLRLTAADQTATRKLTIVR